MWVLAMPRQDKFIVGVRIKYAILEDGHVGVGTLSHDIAAVEHSLLHTDTLGVLRRHNAGQQVQCFDVAVIETRIFLGVEFDGRRGRSGGSGGWIPTACREIFGVDMVAGLDTARNLPVDKVRCSVHFGKQVGQQLAQFLFRHRDVDIQCLGAGVKAVDVVLHQIYLAVGTDCRVIHAVAEEVYPVIEGTINSSGVPILPS